jgi:hypothetical protein
MPFHIQQLDEEKQGYNKSTIDFFFYWWHGQNDTNILAIIGQSRLNIRDMKKLLYITEFSIEPRHPVVHSGWEKQL